MARAQRPTKRRPLTFERIEDRLCMAASVGWDGPGQGTATLTYYVGDIPTSVGMSRDEIEAALETALAAWYEVADITFTQTQTPGLPDSIDFSFVPIDGKGGTLARAYFPDDVNPRIIAGDVQFDTSEQWEVGNARGSAAFDLVYVAVHELGHALGLDHSHDDESVLAARVSANQRFTTLSPHDVDEILAIYAPAKSSTPTPVEPTVSATVPTSPTTPRVSTVPRRTEIPTAIPTNTNTTPTLTPAGFVPKSDTPSTTSTNAPREKPTDADNDKPTEPDPQSFWSFRFNRYTANRAPRILFVPASWFNLSWIVRLRY